MFVSQLATASDLRPSSISIPSGNHFQPQSSDASIKNKYTLAPSSQMSHAPPAINKMHTDFTDTLPRLNFLKNREKNRETGKQVRNPYLPRKSLSKELKNTFFYKSPLKNPHDRARSHEKVPSKMKAPRDLFKQAIPDPILIDQSHLTEKVKIIHNLYCKQERYFYCNRIDIRALVRNIYYHGYTVESLQEFKITAFKRIKNQQEFFGIIYEEGKNFTSTAHRVITSYIEKLVMPSDVQKSSSRNNNPQHSVTSPTFVPFLSHSKKYQQIIDTLYNQFKHLELVNAEIEKLTRHFIKFFLEKHSYECEGFNFHSRLFVIYIYNNHLIFRFFDHLFKLFKKNRFYEEKYPLAFEQIYEIYEDSRQHINEINLSQANSSSFGPHVSCKAGHDGQGAGDFGAKEENWSADASPKQNMETTVTPKNCGVGQAEKSAKSNTEIAPLQADEAGKGLPKKKKKKKNKKKAIAENSTASPEDPQPEPTAVLEGEEDLQDFRSFEEKLMVFDSRYQVLPIKRMKVHFNQAEVEVLNSLLKQIRG